LCLGVSEEEKKRLLHCVVVGGGPTGVEFSGELSDFIKNDVRQTYAHVKDYIHVTLIEVCRCIDYMNSPCICLGVLQCGSLTSFCITFL